ncbi:ewing's tumor-associated antigen 1 isoform X2 [Hyperolius riggenbachi]|uniref:ewing's tumor-associated antigen 1 isoform X2 n=1 Tax=Hyperolius riggenbachi TaxID=752182 RepID=UPI0035A2EADD
MAGRRRQAASRQTCDEEKEGRGEPGASDRETPNKNRSKKLSRASRTTRQTTSGTQEEHGNKKQTSKCTVDISDIVNRIAPKDVKPKTSDAAYFDVWIGEDAIPCTPVVTRTRSKMSRSRILKTEEELMQLAKQLDRNLVEHKDQQVDALETDPNSMNVGTVEQEEDLFLGDVSGDDEVTTALKSVSQSSNTGGAPQNGTQRSVDQEAEEALNALFDCSTQKFSGRLSQGLSDVSTSSYQDALGGVKNSSDKKHCLSKSALPLEKNKDSDQRILPAKVNSGMFKGEGERVKQGLASQKESTPSYDVTQPLSSSQDDFEDDWGEDILGDDSFVMQITQNPELIATPKSNLFHDPKTVGRNNGVECMDKTFKKPSTSKLGTENLSEREEGKIISSITHRTEGSQVNKIEGGGRGGNVAKTFSSVVSRIPSGGPDVKKINTEMRSAYPTFSCTVSKTSTFCSRPSSTREGKDQLAKAGAQTQQQSKVVLKSKDSPHADDWDDPKFSDEVLDMFCDSDSLWEDKEEDDDLLYQVCNDVERLSQVQTSEKISQFPSLGQKASMEAGTTNNGGHSTTVFSSNAIGVKCSKTGIARGSSSSSVSGTRSNSLLNSSMLTTSQIPGLISRSYSVPHGVDCKKTQHTETRLQNTHNPTCTATNPKAPSKYTFTKVKPSQALSVHASQSGNETTSKGLHLQSIGEINKRTTNIHTDLLSSHPPLLKRHASESAVHSSKVFIPESRNKCSMEEIERKKREALARRQMKARSCSSDNAPT